MLSDSFLVFSNQQRQTELIFFLHNEVWFLWWQCSFHHFLSQRSMCSTKCHSYSGLLPTIIDSRMQSLWSPYVHNNLCIFMNKDNINESNVCMHTNQIANGYLVKIVTEKLLLYSGLGIKIEGLHSTYLDERKFWLIANSTTE